MDYQVDIGGGGSPSWAGSTRARTTYYGLHQRAATLADEEPDAFTIPTRWNQY